MCKSWLLRHVLLFCITGTFNVVLFSVLAYGETSIRHWIVSFDSDNLFGLLVALTSFLT